MGAIDRGLGVVALHVAILGLQDAALGMGEVTLRLAVGLRLRRRSRVAGLLGAFRLALLLRLGARFRLRLGGGPGFGLQLGLGLADLLKPLLLVGYPVGHLVAALVAVEPVLLPIGGLRRLEPAIDLGLEFRFPLFHPNIAHRLVPGPIGLYLMAVQTNIPQLHQARPLRQP